jgi:hypothetical protein
MSLARNLARLFPNASGLLPNANIEAMAASKLTGQVPDANAPSGSVIQVVQTVKSNSFSTTSNSLVDITGFSATITPSNVNNKILMMFSMNLRGVGDQGYVTIGIYKGATQLLDGYAIEGNASDMRGGICWTYLDSPSTTSPVTYNAKMSAQFTNTSYLNSTTNPSTIILMEIAA